MKMSTEQQLEKALQIAKEAHKGQVDKGGKDYFSTHIMAVINGVESDEEKTVAALHDVVEDTNVTFRGLLHEGFDRKIVESVGAMTHNPMESYGEYIERIRHFPLAKAVKKSDLRNNMDISWIPDPSEADFKRLEKYKAAYARLEAEDDTAAAMATEMAVETGASESCGADVAAEMIDQNTQDKIRASLIGFAVGDALGVPAEFHTRDEMRENPVTDMIGFVSHEVPAGTWSDDTSMTIATMASIIDLKKIDYDDIMKRFVRWYKDAEYTAGGEVFDIGLTTKRAIDRYIHGKRFDKCGSTSFNENGNGSLMRMLPLAIYFCLTEPDDREKTGRIYYLSSLTHGHEISLLGCRIYCDLYKSLLQGKSIQEACAELPTDVYDRFYDDAMICYKRILDGSILGTEEDQIKSTGYVVDTLEAVVWCLANSSSYTETVIKAANLGRDTDTIAAIAGSLAAVMYGSSSIPVKWTDILQQSRMLDELANDYLNTMISMKS